MHIRTIWVIAILMLLISTLAHAEIVFTSNRDGIREIYVMNDDGSRVKRLTSNKFSEMHPAWSPDGKQIAFTRNLGPDIHNPQYEIFIMDANGSNQRNLTKHPANDDNASWSPDGRYIAFDSSRTGRHNISTEIHLFDLLSGQVRQLTNSKGVGVFANFPSSANFPSWSPNGKFIVYKQITSGHIIINSLYIIDVKTKQKKQLLQPKPNISGQRPRWSPDGKYILYYESNAEAAVANADPNNPNFRDIVFRLTTRRLAIVSVDGIEQLKLSIPKEWSIHYLASWSPDSKEFVFSASPQGRGGNWDIYRYNLVTHEIIRLTNHAATDTAPNWFNPTLSVSPAGKMATQWGQIKQ